MNTPSVSIVIPARNEEGNIERCLTSIRSADYPEDLVEVVLVDNGSTDRTQEIALRYGAKVIRRPLLKVGALRNEGVRESRGEIIAFVDADCEVDVSWIREGVRRLEDPGVAVSGSYPDLPPSPTLFQRVWAMKERGRPESDDALWVPSMNMFIKRDLFISPSIRGFNEGLESCEDVDLCLRVRKFHRIVYSTAIRVVHHGEPAGVREFVKREYWHGMGNLRGFLSHPFTWAELPSILIPFLFLGLTLTLILSILLLPFLPALFKTAVVATPMTLTGIPITRASLALKGRGFRYIPYLSFIYFIYYMVRGVAILKIF